jgi:hypothetical protein
LRQEELKFKTSQEGGREEEKEREREREREQDLHNFKSYRV